MPPTAQDPNDNDAGRAEAAGRMLLDTAPLANPFVGLRPFESEEALLFFGRDEQTTELMQQLHLTRFLAVVGGSGCGKSSLIRAGLIPKLKAGFLLADRGDWRVATMKPGKAPLQNLAAALLSAFDEDPAGGALRPLVEEIEASGTEAVTEYVSRRMGGKAANVLLLVDQFEEIFRFGAFTDEDPNDDPDEREGRRAEAADFVSIMLGLTRDEAVPVYVVMTMRSDFLGDCDAFHGLPQAMNRSQYLVPRLTRQQRLEAIQCPVRLCRKRISPELSVRVLDDMGEDPDQLPVMQHALMRTFDKSMEEEQINPRRDEGPGHYDMRVEHYEAVGTIKAALSKDADEALAGMTPEELIVTERMFQALVETDAKERRVRRPVHMSEVEAITGAARPRIENIIARLRGNNRSFLALSEDRLHGDPLIDISHESLIRQWETLRGWVKDEVKSREQYLRLAKDAALYYDPEKPKVALWRDPALQLALDWWDERRPNETWARRYHEGFAPAREFLDASLDNRAREEAEVAEAQRRELDNVQKIAAQRARTNRLLVAATVILAFLLLVAGGGVVYAFRAQREAQQSAIVANIAKAELEEKKRTVDSLLDSERTAKAELEDKKLKVDKLLESELITAARLKDETKKAVEANQRAQEAATKAESDRKTALNALSALRDSRRAEEATQQVAARRQRVDELRRKAGKEQEAVKIEQARGTYIEAAQGYADLRDHGGVAYTYAEVGKMMIEQPATDWPSSSLTAASLRRELDDEAKQEIGDRNWVASVLLADAKPEAPFPRLDLGPEPTMGLRYYATAIKTYREIKDFNGSAAALDKVGNFLAGAGKDDEGIEEDIEESVQNRRDKAADDSFCAALGDYQEAQNLDGQISMLTRIGDRLLDNAPTASEAKDDEAGGGEAAAWASTETEEAGCSGLGSDGLKYLEKSVPLYSRMIGQPGQKPEQVKGLREKLAGMLVRIALIYRDRKDADGTTEKLREATTLAGLEVTADALMEASGGIISNTEPPAWHYETAAKLYRDAGRPEGEARTLSALGRRYVSWVLNAGLRVAYLRTAAGRRPVYQKAANSFKQALDIYDRLNDRAGGASTRINYGSALIGANKPDEALAEYQSALKFYETAADKSGQARAHYGIGRVEEGKTQKEQAEKSYRKAVSLAGASDDQSTLLSAQRALQRLKAPPPTPTPTPPGTPSVKPEASPAPASTGDVDLDADLAGAGSQEGDVDYEFEDGVGKLNVSVEKTNLQPRTRLTVTIGDWKDFITLDESGGGELDLKTKRGQKVPPLAAGMQVTVTDESGKVVVSGTFVDRVQAKTISKPKR